MKETEFLAFQPTSNNVALTDIIDLNMPKNRLEYKKTLLKKFTDVFSFNIIYMANLEAEKLKQNSF